MTPFIVAIVGGTASGKSTLADALVASLGSRATSVSHDWYYRSIPAHLVGHPRLAFEHNFDHPDALDNRLLNQHLARLARGQGVVAPEYDYASATAVPDRRPIPAAEIVVVDGILLLAAPEITQSRLDLIVFVDTPADIRLARRIRRDVTVRKLPFDYVLDLYETSVRPMHEKFVEPSKARADFVVDGTRPVDELVKFVIARLPAHTVTWLGPYGPACDDACWKCSGCGSYEEGPPKTCPRCGGDTA